MRCYGGLYEPCLLPTLDADFHVYRRHGRRTVPVLRPRLTATFYRRSACLNAITAWLRSARSSVSSFSPTSIAPAAAASA